jgi:hypothetical protein
VYQPLLELDTAPEMEATGRSGRMSLAQWQDLVAVVVVPAVRGRQRFKEGTEAYMVVAAEVLATLKPVGLLGPVHQELLSSPTHQH